MSKIMNMMNNIISRVDQATCTSTKVNDDDEEVALPGFRFHPTDEELVGFYLRRKVEKKSLKIELIKQVDIYKYDPWDLPKPSGVGEKEGYFFCKRGRKYRNSIRPNRVTGSGFWKATGIDKPVYNGECRVCIGLKKTLVYYRGSAGKGTKTDWMMHEFRLPVNESTTTSIVSKPSTQEAEVWTLCRIFKRNVSHRKYTPDWRELSNKKQANQIDKSSVTTCSTVENSNSRENYLSFTTPNIQFSCEEKPVLTHVDHERTKFLNLQQWNSMAYQHQQVPPSMVSSSNNNNLLSPYGNDFLTYGDWDELRSVVEFAFDHDSSSHV